jgi:hypothetical protein
MTTDTEPPDNNRYDPLRARRDSLGTGFPASGRGSEMRILKALFSKARPTTQRVMSPMWPLHMPDSTESGM